MSVTERLGFLIDLGAPVDIFAVFSRWICPSANCTDGCEYVGFVIVVNLNLEMLLDVLKAVVAKGRILLTVKISSKLSKRYSYKALGFSAIQSCIFWRVIQSTRLDVCNRAFDDPSDEVIDAKSAVRSGS